MPVSTGAGSSNADRAKRCKHCEESGHRLDSGNLFWRIQLDQDLLDTIIAIYPEWFKDYNLSRVGTTMAEGGSGGTGAAPDTGHSSGGQPSTPNSTGLLPLSPPKAEVDDSPLQKSMDKNKESLKVKLMLRRPITQLVAQGIMPPLKTPPAFHEQRQKLERAKMGDLLKAKIQQRPDRQELVRQHILEADMGHVDPSLAERQRMLKKARLADSLNDQLSHRPGPLELIKKNILHTEEPIERAVKEGVIPFKATCEGQLTKPQHPNRYITFEEDSQSSEGAQSPLQTQAVTSISEVRPQQSDVLEAAAASAGIVTVALTIPTTGGAVVVTSASPAAFQQAVAASASSNVDQQIQQQQTATVTFAELCNNVMSGNAQLPTVTSGTTSLPTILPLAPTPSPMSLGSTTSSLSPLSSVSVSSPPAPPTPSPTLTITPRPAPQPSPISLVSSHRTDAPGKDKNRKKSKSKSQPKTRTIKFHEYKGPPNAHKSSAMSAVSPVETSYELLLQQQQLFLQWQLEWQHKYPQIILPAAQKPLSVSSDSVSSGSAVTAPSLSGLIAVASPPPQTLTVASTGTSATSTVTVAAPISNSAPVPSPATPSTPQEQTQQPILRTLTKLEDMKVSDLKAELKKRNLPVSGSKPQLIERLKPFTDSLNTSQQDGQVASSSNTPVVSISTSTNTTTAATTIPVTQMGHILMDTPGTVISEESLSGLSMETPVSPPNQQMSLVLDGSVGDDDVSLPNFSPSSQQQQLSPLSQNMSPDSVGGGDIDMDTTDGNPLTVGSPLEQQGSPQPPSPQQQALVSEDIIRDQQRKIEELQRELLKSQLQLQQIRNSKELNNPQRLKQQQTLISSTATIPNGIVIDPATAAAVSSSAVAASKHQQKLKQHLQQKIQQQQIQMQLQQLQQLQTLQQQQRQQQQQQQQQQHIAFQQQQQQQQGLNAKASLAAFLQSQSQQQQQLANLLQQQQQSAANNKNSNPNNKRNNTKSIILGQQQAAIVLNQLNLQKQKVAALNGVSGHQRTSSLPNFFGSFVTQQQLQSDSSKDASSSSSLTRSGGENQQFLVTKPPPQYEEATKQLKVKQETDANNSGCKSNSSRPKSVKSQIVDDVLEILIKNGELPPSAAQDPATPTTPGRSMPQGLVFTSTTETPTPASSPPAPPPPPPPPLPHTTFAITLPTAISLTSHANSSPFNMQFSGSDSLDFILGSVEGGSSISDVDGQHQEQQVHALVANADLQGPPPNIDLKELGLDLETLDPMDFGQLDCSDLGVPVVKMEPADLLDSVTDMEIGGTGGEAGGEVKMGDQQACELMDIGEMPMDMDDADWLESLMPPADSSAGGSAGDGEGGNSIMTPPHQPLYLATSTTQGNFHFNHNHLHNGHNSVELDSYDPLLSNSQDPFDLFNIEESEFKMAGDLNAALGWSDKVDFAT